MQPQSAVTVSRSPSCRKKCRNIKKSSAPIVLPVRRIVSAAVRKLPPPGRCDVSHRVHDTGFNDCDHFGPLNEPPKLLMSNRDENAIMTVNFSCAENISM